MNRNLYRNLSVLFMVLITMSLSAQPNLSWRMNNPRIINEIQSDWLVFDLEVMNDTPDKYFTEMSVVFNFNGNGLSRAAEDLITEPGPRYDTLNSMGTPRYVQMSFVDESSFTILMSSDSAVRSIPATEADFTKMLTGWDLWAVVRIRIVNPDEMAGLTFRSLEPNGFSTGTYRDENSTTDLPFRTPHLVETKTFAKLYLERIFSMMYGFTQAGGLDMSEAVNTSIWDSTAAPADSVVRADKMRIHPYSPVGNLPNEIGGLPGGIYIILTGNVLYVEDSLIIESERGLVTDASAGGYGQLMDNGIYYGPEGSGQANAWFEPEQWHLYSPAVQTVDYFDFAGTTIKYYNELDSSNAGGVGGPYHDFKAIINFEMYPFDTIVLPPMTGYSVWVEGEDNPVVSPKGLFNTGIVSGEITLSPWFNQNPPYDGWNLTGNPYPSSIDLSHENVLWGNTEEAAWFWNPDMLNYEVWVGNGEGTRLTSIVAAQQGFFVRHSAADSMSTMLTLDNSVRVVDEVPFLKQGYPDMLRLNVVSEASGYEDRVVVRLADDATSGYDQGTDAWKRMGDVDAPQLYTYTEDSLLLTVNVLPWNMEGLTVRLGFRSCDSGSYILTASNLESFADREVFLEDILLNVTRNLNTDPEYTFTTGAGIYDERFLLHFMNVPVGTSHQGSESARIYSWDEYLYIMEYEGEGQILVFDMTGRNVFSGRLLTGLITRYNPGVSPGIYTVVVRTEAGTSIGKVYLR